MITSRVVKLQIQAGKATSGPPLGPVLGQFKIPMMEFCKDFNEKTQHFNSTLMLTTILILYEDNTYSYIVKIPKVSNIVKQLVNLELLNGTPGSFIIDNTDISKEKLHSSFSILSPQIVYEVVLLYKEITLSVISVRSLYRTFLASLKSMGVFVFTKKN